MKFTLSWLKDHLDTDAGLEDITAELTAIGLEVEQVVDRSAELAPFTVAEILEAEAHPNADKLKLCKVNDGTQTLQIVCGAPNARAGIKVVLASVGSVIPTNGMNIKQAKIRDVESNGMLCSAAELGIGDDGGGIIELPEDAVIGEPFAHCMGLDDPMIEIAITPNRGDCLGVRGIARDLAAREGGGTLRKLEINPTQSSFTSDISISIEDTKKTPLFIGRYIKNVRNVPSPDWLQNRLKSIGLRPISALVDITNYLSYDLGRPAHVFDADKLKGNIVVRDAKQGETLEGLDEHSYTLDDGMIVIADDNGVQGLGGIMGGEPTGCTNATTNVLLEIALFDPVTIAHTGRKLQILSDARYRFERSVDPAFLYDATEIATRLIVDLCGGEASEIVVAGKEPDWQKTLTLRPERIKTLTGVTIDEKEIKDILQKLGFTISSNKEGFAVTVPSWRSDVEQEVDLIEEIIRIHGYEHIPATPMPQEAKAQAALTPMQRRKQETRRILATRGMREVTSFSFMDSNRAALFGAVNDNLRLSNPISAELDTMRPSILPNLLDAVTRNSARGFADLALFEAGPVFAGVKAEEQYTAISGVRSGLAVTRNPHEKTRNVDAFDAKADLLAALSAYLDPRQVSITRDVPDYYHPGKAGVLQLGKQVLGYFGELHPAVLRAMDIKQAAGFELFLNRLPAPKQKKRFTKSRPDISNYQSVERDFAFVVDKNVLGQDIEKAVRAAEKSLIKRVSFFDIYEGDKIEKGKKSIALSVKLQPKDHTFAEEEIENISRSIIDNVKSAVGGVLRG